MKLTAQEIAEIVRGEISGNPETTVTGVASLQDATNQDCSYLAHQKFLREFSNSKAGIILLPKNISHSNSFNTTLIFVENPQLAFLKILEIVAGEKKKTLSGIDPTAIIAKDAQLGAGVSIGPYTIIESEASLGEGSEIGAQCYVGRKTQIGTNCKIYPRVTIGEEIQIGNQVIIHSGTVIGADGFGYVTVNGVHHKIPQIGRVEIQDDVEIGANVTIDRATMGKTVIGKGTKIDNLVQVAHNVKIGAGCLLAAQSGIAGSSELGNFVVLAGQVGVADHVKIGDRTIAAAQSGIPGEIPAGSIVFGSPARPIQEERKIQVILGKLPKLYEEFRKIKKLLKIDSSL